MCEFDGGKSIHIVHLKYLTIFTSINISQLYLTIVWSKQNKKENDDYHLLTSIPWVSTKKAVSVNNYLVSYYHWVGNMGQSKLADKDHLHNR